jgi:hypothetical protein
MKATTYKPAKVDVLIKDVPFVQYKEIKKAYTNKGHTVQGYQSNYYAGEKLEGTEL